MLSFLETIATLALRVKSANEDVDAHLKSTAATTTENFNLICLVPEINFQNVHVRVGCWTVEAKHWLPLKLSLLSESKQTTQNRRKNLRFMKFNIFFLYHFASLAFRLFVFFVASTTTILEEIPFPLLAEEHIWIKSFRCWGLGWVEICIRRRASPSHYRLTIAHIFQMHRHVTQLPNSSEPKTTAFPAPRKSRKAEKFQRLNYSQWWRFSRDRVLP